MLFIMCKASEEASSWRSQRKDNVGWVTSHAPRSDSRYPAQPGGKPSTRSSRGAGSSSSGGKASDYGAGSSSRGMERNDDHSLYQNMGSLSLGGHDLEPVRVKIVDGNYWHKQYNTFAPVEDFKVENGQLLVKINGERRVAVVIPDAPSQDVYTDTRPPKKKWYQRATAV